MGGGLPARALPLLIKVLMMIMIISTIIILNYNDIGNAEHTPFCSITLLYNSIIYFDSIIIFYNSVLFYDSDSIPLHPVLLHWL